MLLARSGSRIVLDVVVLTALLLAGCAAGSKTFTVVVEITLELEGVEIRKGSPASDILATTNEQGRAELKNITKDTVLVPVKEGYAFDPVDATVYEAGTVRFKATPVPKTLTVKSAAPQDDIVVLINTTPFEDLPLAEAVTVTLSDDSQVQLAVEWQEGSYNPDAAGEYALEGLLVLEGDIVNPDNVKAAVKVTVRYVPEPDEPYYEEAGKHLSQLIPEETTEDLTLPTRFQLESGESFTGLQYPVIR